MKIDVDILVIFIFSDFGCLVVWAHSYQEGALHFYLLSPRHVLVVCHRCSVGFAALVSNSFGFRFLCFPFFFY